MTQPSHDIDGQPVGLPRRFGAILYDTLLLVAIWMVLAGLMVLFGNLTGWYSVRLHLALNLLAGWGFFYIFWTRTGQTLGMQTWNIQLRTEGGQPVSAWSATVRYLVAAAQWLLILGALGLAREYGALLTTAITAVLLLGLGISLFHPRQWMLHDWLSGTELVRIPGQARPRWKSSKN